MKDDTVLDLRIQNQSCIYELLRPTTDKHYGMIILKIRKGSANPSVSPTFAVGRRLNKNGEKTLKIFL